MKLFSESSMPAIHNSLITVLTERAPTELWNQMLDPTMDAGGIREIYHIPEIPNTWYPLALYASLYSPFDLHSHGRLTYCRIATRCLEIDPTPQDTRLFLQVAATNEWKQANSQRETPVPSSVEELPVRMFQASLKYDIDQGLGNMIRGLMETTLGQMIQKSPGGPGTSELNGRFEESIADAAGYVAWKCGEELLYSWCETDYVDHLQNARNGNEQAAMLLALELERRARPPLKRGGDEFIQLLLDLRERSRVFSGLETLIA